MFHYTSDPKVRVGAACGMAQSGNGGLSRSNENGSHRIIEIGLRKGTK
jgi:hypothetical protein